MSVIPVPVALQTLSEDVRVGARTVHVSTTKLGDEAMEKWIERHNEAVRAIN
jgi:adenosyl cobinamide kinase/adenosyl cobinamide phosphate guanylyltransferase